MERAVRFRWVTERMGVLRVALNQRVHQRKEERKGGEGTIWENEEKDLLCLQMQEAHLIGTLRWPHWHCGPSPPPASPGSESLQLTAACSCCSASPTRGQEGLMHRQEIWVSLET